MRLLNHCLNRLPMSVSTASILVLFAVTATTVAVAQVGGPRPTGRADLVVWPSRDFPTLQSAINELADGGVLRIRPGRHVVREPVYIERRLTIEGRGSCHHPSPHPSVEDLRSGKLTRFSANADLPGADGNGPALLFRSQSFLVGPPPMEIREVNSAVGLFNLVGPGARVTMKGLNMTGFDTAIFSRDEPEVPGGFLVARDVCIANTGRGITWLSSGAISMFDSTILNTLWNGVSIAPALVQTLKMTATFWGVQIYNIEAWCVYSKNGLVIAHNGLFLGCNAGGIYVEDAGSSVDDSVLFGLGGPGLMVQRSGAYFENNIVMHTVVAGVFLFDSSAATILNNTVSDTAAGINGILGDGLAAIGSSQVVIDQNTFANSARAGISSFGSNMFIHATTLRCQAFDMGAEPNPYNGDPATFDDLGAVFCGCPEANEPWSNCLAKSYALEPPPPVGGLE